jgi:ribosomal protein L40E
MSDQTAPESDRRGVLPWWEPFLQRWRLVVAVVYVALGVAANLVGGPGVLILLLAGGALVAVIAVFWASLRTLFGETPLSGADAYALGAPRAEEEQKQAVLRALKDLEFERSVGKISEEDYQVLVARYRAEAKRLLRLLDADAQPRRQQVEALVTDHLRKEGLLEGQGEAVEDVEKPSEDESSAPAEEDREAAPKQKKKKRKSGAAAKPKDEPAAKPKDELAALVEEVEEGDEKPAVKEHVCSECGTLNDSDAVFCKKCGARQKPAAEPTASNADSAKAADSEAGA